MIKKALLFIFVFSLAVGMTACAAGWGKEDGDQAQDAGTGMQLQGGADWEGAEQYAYSNIIMDFAEYGSDVAVRDIAGRGEWIYVLLEVREWEPEPEDPIQKQEYTSCYQVFRCLADGSRKEISGKIDLPEDGGYVYEMQLSDDGSVAILFYSDAGDSVRLIFWDGFRNEHWEKEIAAGGYLFRGEESIVILAKNGDGRVADTYDLRGELSDSVNLGEDLFKGLQKCFYTSDQRFLLVKTDSGGTPYGEFYDMKTGRGEQNRLPENVLQYQIFQGTVKDILLCGNAGVLELGVGETTPTELLSYVDAGLDVGNFQMVWQMDETRLAGIFSDGGITKLGIFERIRVPAGSRKEVVTLGIVGELNAGLRSRIIEFNQESSRYRITVKQYVTYDEELDALTQLNTDILSGKMPDILVIDNAMPLQSWAAKGLLADVGKLLEEDGELDSGQFMENVLDAFRMNGRLYYVIPSFCVDTLVAKQSKVGERAGWNQEEFAAVAAGLPEGTKVVSEISRYDYLNGYMRVCGREYVDADQGKCNFCSEGFVSALKFAATLPEYAESSFYEENSYDSQYLEDKALLQPVTIRFIPQLAQQIYGCIGEDIAYVGYPSENGQGSCIRISGIGFVLSAQGGKIEGESSFQGASSLQGAWEFARYYLTADFQRDRLHEYDEGNGMPSRRDVFYEEAQRAAAWEGYCFINDEFVRLPPMTQAQIDQATGFIGTLRNAAFEDEVIMRIIYEEAGSLFQGQKTAEDVAGLIQNRAQLYLSEGM